MAAAASLISQAMRLDPLEPRRHFAVDLVGAITQSLVQVVAHGDWCDLPLTMSNLGTTPAATGSAPWGGAEPIPFNVSLSTDRVAGNGDDHPFLAGMLGGPLNPGQTMSFDASGSAPDLPVGSYYVICAVDNLGAFDESDESNNVIVSTLPLVQIVPLSTETTVWGTPGHDRIWVQERAPYDHSRLLVYVNGDYTVYEPPAYHSPEGIAAYLPLVIEGGAGDDIIGIEPTVTSPMYIIGGHGRDKINAGSVASTLSGGIVNDLIHATPGDDYIEGGVGNDRIFGYAGDDTILAFGGNDLLDGGAGSDFLSGMNGNDVLLSRDGERDTLTGGLLGADQGEVDEDDEVAGVELLLP